MAKKVKSPSHKRKVTPKEIAAQAGVPEEDAVAAEASDLKIPQENRGNNGYERFYFERDDEFKKAAKDGKFEGVISPEAFEKNAAELAGEKKILISDKKKDNKRVIVFTMGIIPLVLARYNEWEKTRVVGKGEIQPLVEEIEKNIRYYNNRNLGLDLDPKTILRNVVNEYRRTALSPKEDNYREVKNLLDKARGEIEDAVGKFLFLKVDELFEKAISMGFEKDLLDPVRVQVTEARKIPNHQQQCRTVVGIKRALEEATDPNLSFNVPVEEKKEDFKNLPRFDKR